MHIDWSALARVAAVSLAVTAAVVVVFTLGVLGHSRAADRRTGPATTPVSYTHLTLPTLCSG
mgnify:CR=1 FL=1